MNEKTGRTSRNTILFIQKYSTYLIFAVMIILCILVSDNFFTVINITNIFKQQAYVIIVSMGMLFVILTGGIDLSVGSIVALSGVCMAHFMSEYGMSIATAALITIIIGILCGLCNGIFISYVKLPAFIMTMSMMTIARGIGYVISNGSPVKTPPNSIIGFSTYNLFGIRVLPVLAIVALLIVVICAFIVKYTVFGRMVIAIGSNSTAVRLAGIRDKLYRTVAYVFSGCCSAIGGILLSTRTGLGSPNVGSGLELDCIAACVIGGASLSGGEGSVIKTLLGVLILALIGNMMNLLAVPAYPQDIAKGVIIILSIVLQIFTSEKKTQD